MLITYFLSGGPYILIGGFKGGAKDAPLGKISLVFMGFSAKIQAQIQGLTPSSGKPGSATELLSRFE